MREAQWVAAVGLGLVTAGFAAAQQPTVMGSQQPSVLGSWSSGSSFLSGVSPGQRVYQVIDTSNSLAPAPSALQNPFNPSSALSRNLSSFLSPRQWAATLFSKPKIPNFNLASLSTMFSSSKVPTSSQPSPIQPVAPLSSGPVPVPQTPSPFQPEAPVISRFIPFSKTPSPFQPVAPIPAN